MVKYIYKAYRGQSIVLKTNYCRTMNLICNIFFILKGNVLPCKKCMVELAKYENEYGFCNNNNNRHNRYSFYNSTNNNYNNSYKKQYRKHFYNFNEFIFSIVQYNIKNNRFFCSPSHKAVRRLRYLFNLNCKKKTR